MLLKRNIPIRIFMKNCFTSYSCIILICIASACDPKNIDIGDTAPELTTVSWLHSSPLQISKLKSKVILIRWWTDECVYCEQSKEALNKWFQHYSEKGLVIIGMYHPKPFPKKMDIEELREMVIQKNFQFPIAVDEDWKNLDNFKPNRNTDDFTSASYLIDKKGVVRYYHKGGEYHSNWEPGHEQCVAVFHQLDSCIKLLLLEK
jgi:peroxiredoxin